MTSLPFRLERWRGFFEKAGAFFELDPLLLAAICDRESRGGEALVPTGPGGLGDNGHGHGLMQIDDRSHRAFCCQTYPDGRLVWKDAEANIQQGALILATAMRGFGGDEVKALAAYNAGTRRVHFACAELTAPADPLAILAACDAVTTGGNYASDVLRRRDALSKPHKESPP